MTEREIESVDYQADVAARNRPCGPHPCMNEFPGMPSRWCSGCLIAALLTRIQPLAAAPSAGAGAQDEPSFDIAHKMQRLALDRAWRAYRHDDAHRERLTGWLREHGLEVWRLIAASPPPPPPDTLVEAVEYVVERFRRDEADGYRSRDRQFAIEILAAALARLRAPTPPDTRKGCINCGEANDGGYETEEVGAFCSQCWQSLADYFDKLRATTPTGERQHADAALAAAPSAGAGAQEAVPGSDVLCESCARVFCPHEDRLHFDKDGCPSCEELEGPAPPPPPPDTLDREALVEDMRARKDAAYAERNQVVAALSKLWPAHLALHPVDDEAWERDWLTIVCIHSPMGQLSWHVHDSQVGHFAHLPIAPNDWDGHDTPEKYRRLARLRAPTPTGETR